MTAVLIPLLVVLGPLAVLLLMAVAYAETGILAGFFLPGDAILFAAGVLTATSVISVPLWLVIVAVTTAAVLGDQTGFLIGRRFGPRVLNRPRSRLLHPGHVTRAEAFFAAHGPKTVVLARFVPVARTLTPVIAGVGRMPRALFTVYNVVGAILWTVSMLCAGYFLGGVPLVAHHVELITVAIVTFSLVPTVAGLVRRHRRSHATGEVDRDAQLETLHR